MNNRSQNILNMIRERPLNKAKKPRSWRFWVVTVFTVSFYGWAITSFITFGNSPEYHAIEAKRNQEELADKKYHAELNTCVEKYVYTDSGRETSSMMVHYAYKKMDKSFLLNDKNDSELAHMFCDMTVKK